MTNNYSQQDIEEALQAIASMISKSEKAQEGFAPDTSQYTLQKNRIKALHIAWSLIKNELSDNSPSYYLKADLEAAVNPITSLISKSGKAYEKLRQGMWQHTMLGENLKALYMASLLLTKALHNG